MLYDLTHLHTILVNLPKGQLFVLTDSHTAEYCLPILADSIGQIPYHLLTIEAGEQSKNLASVQAVWDFMLKHRATREALLINLGGGMITDLGGFAAATYMRGIRFVNIPTTLLAMVDASSGGKTGVDYQGIKNVIGTFTPPVATLIHPDFLRTLPAIELLSGFAEMLKHALIASPKEWIKLLQLAQEELPQEQFVEALSSIDALQASIQIKENVVSQDPHEAGLRKILNFGHTVGHAIESTMLHQTTPHYTMLHHTSHGYCVLWGMVAEVYLSVVHTGCPREVLQQLTQIMLQWYGKPQCDCKQRDQLIQRMYQDKKNNANQTPNFTLLRNIGEPIINQHLTEADINEALEYLFSL
ncbi:MAG: 3-dehydroquinate synthase [Paludibacteraceae bacterium]|nr:3-dehydroquinate synthase [Paludibacteraceae bacterium]